MKNDNIQCINPLKGIGVYQYNDDKEKLFILYRKQILNMYEKDLISLTVVSIALCIIRKELGLPFLCIYPVLNTLDNITH